MNTINELNRIGKSEINFSISYFYDNCWTFRLGDELNGFTYEKTHSSFQAGVNGLIQEIIVQFPHSDYIAQLKKRSTYVFHGLDLF